MRLAAQCTNGVGLCFIPHPKNDHRPFAVRHPTLALLSLALLFTKAAALTITAIMPLPAELSTITADRVVQLANVERRKVGFNELTISPLLTTAAIAKGKDMLAHDYFAHISPSGITPWFWMSKVGYTYTIAGENLAIDFTEVEDVVAAWMASPSHRENLLLKEYTEIGIGVVEGEFQGGTSIIVVQMFGRPTVAKAPPSVKAVLDTTPVAPPANHVRSQPIAFRDVVFLVSPATDSARIAVFVPQTPQITLKLIAAEATSLTLPDQAGQERTLDNLVLTPQFSMPKDQDLVRKPSRVNQFGHRLSATVFVFIGITLALTILIRIRIQHPVLIAHSLVVGALSLVLFFF